MHQTFPLLFAVLLFSTPATAAPVSWGSHSTLFSREQTSQTGYSLQAYRASGRLHILADVTYSLRFRDGQISVGGKSLKAGCMTGTLKKGDILLFQKAQRVELQIPSAGCQKG